MLRYPLFFSHGGLVAGRGFIAQVQISGRAIVEQTGDAFFTALGVNPGAAAGHGATQSEAMHAMLEDIKLVIFELASQAAGFDEFAATVREYALATHPNDQADWDEAVRLVRAGQVATDAFPTRKPAETKAAAEVHLVATQPERSPESLEPSPELNEVADGQIAAVA